MPSHETDCNRLIEAMRPRLRAALGAGVDIRAALDPALWPAAADPAALEAALVGLAQAARSAMTRGGSLSIATANLPLDARFDGHHPGVPAGRYVMIALTDDGADAESAAGRLEAAQGLARDADGHATLVGEPGLGTTVRLYLPVSAGVETAPVEDARQDAALPRGRATVLVAEDDPLVRAYAVAALESLGYTVLAAVDGRDALSQLARTPAIELLFTDIVMSGGMNGWELAERALRLKPDLKILLTSGYALETLAARGRLPDGTIVLNKPYRKAELARRLDEALKTSR